MWRRPLASGDEAVAIFNHSNQAARAEVEWRALGIGKDWTVRDVWAKANRGTNAEGFFETVPAHGVMTFRLHKMERTP